MNAVRFLMILLALIAHLPAQEAEEDYMREELGVNEFTAPSISWLMVELDRYKPLPDDPALAFDRGASYSNRLQRALHFGGLVTDGFLAALSEQKGEIVVIGKALLRQSQALGVGNKLSSRSNHLFELSERGSWADLRTELVAAQKDVEDSMIDLRDEQMAHMISLGGWLRGFHAAVVSTAARYTPQRAEGLQKPDLLDYYIDRLDTLHPQLKQTELVIIMSSRLKTIRQILEEAKGGTLTEGDVVRIRELTTEIAKATASKTDSQGNIQE